MTPCRQCITIDEAYQGASGSKGLGAKLCKGSRTVFHWIILFPVFPWLGKGHNEELLTEQDAVSGTVQPGSGCQHCLSWMSLPCNKEISLISEDAATSHRHIKPMCCIVESISTACQLCPCLYCMACTLCCASAVFRHQRMLYCQHSAMRKSIIPECGFQKVSSNR